MNKIVRNFSMLLLIGLLFSNVGKAQSCHPYIQQLSNGSLKFSVTFSQAQFYVEVFAKQNGIQNIATNIVSSQVLNANGTYTYSYTAPAANYASGDVVVTRFYSYRQGQPGVFTPGPAEIVWSSDFVYNQTCNSAIYVSINGLDTNPGTLSSPVRTIAKGIALASSQGKTEVKVSQGTYVEGNLNVANGVSLLGGYSSNFSARDITLNQYITTIDANQPTGFGICGEKRILNINNIYLTTIVEGFVMTRGRLCNYGGGIYINNSNILLIIRNNKIINNSSVGNGTSGGGNIYITSSSPQISNNVITGGFSGANYGNDLYMNSNQVHGTAIISNNVFTTESAVVGLEKSNHAGNTYLNQTLVHVSTSGNDANIGTNEAPVKTITYGLSLAQSKNSSQVRISAGTYVEGNLIVRNGISIYGGYSADFFTSNPYTYVTIIDAQQPTGFMVCGSKRIFKAENITLPTVISGLTLKGGRLCDFGGGIYINNSSELLSIENNKITGNSSVGNGTSNGGNIYVLNSAAKIRYNEITNGFAGGGYGHDIAISGSYSNGVKTEVAYNTITAPSTVYGASEGNVHDNTYLNPARQAAAPVTNDYMPMEVKVVNDKLLITTENEEIAVEVLDLTGRTKIQSKSKETSVSELSSGIYIIKAESNSSVVTEKVYIK
jgi:hypothetical protein